MLKRLLRHFTPQPAQTVYVVQFRRADQRFVSAVVTREEKAHRLCLQFCAAKYPNETVIQNGRAFYVGSVEHGTAIALYTELTLDGEGDALEMIDGAGHHARTA